MVLDYQDSGVSLSTTEPSSPTTTASTSSTKDLDHQQFDFAASSTGDHTQSTNDDHTQSPSPRSSGNDSVQSDDKQAEQAEPKVRRGPLINGQVVHVQKGVVQLQPGTSKARRTSTSSSSSSDKTPATTASTSAAPANPTPTASATATTKTATKTTSKTPTTKTTSSATSSPSTATTTAATTTGSAKKSVGQRISGAFGRLTGKDKTPKQPKPGPASPAAAPPTASATLSPSAIDTLSPKDQKILAIMQVRKSEEERLKEEQRKKHMEWEQENRRLSIGAKSRTASVRQNRLSVGGRDCLRPQLTVAIGQLDAADGSSSGTPERVASPDVVFDSHSNSPSDSRRTSVSSSMSCLADGRLYDPIRMRQLHNMDKKRSVEQRLEQQRREMEEHARQVKMKQEQDLQRANSLRLSRAQQQAMKARLINERVQQKHEQISKQKQQSLMDLNELQESIDAKLAAAEQKAQRLREEETKRRSELQKRLEQSRQRQQDMEAELEKWREELVRFREWQGDNAEKIAQQNKAMKSMNACKLRLEKEKKQQENMSKLMTNEEKRLADIEASIDYKDSRTSSLLKEKEEVIMRSRERAQTMKQMRDELRIHYSMTDIDQLSRHAALENRLMARAPDSAQTSLGGSVASLV